MPSLQTGADDRRRARGRRRDRYQLRATAARITRLDRIRACGARRVDSESQVAVGYNAGAGVAGYRGLQTCGSIHSCAVCAAKIRQARGQEVDRAVAAHRAAGGSVLFVTLTVPHVMGQGLAELWDAVSGSWRKVLQARQWRAFGAEHGIVFGRSARRRFPVIRSLEVTYGENGWHPHLHVAIFTGRALEACELAELEAWLTGAWQAAVVGYGIARPSDERGVTLSVVEDGHALADYLCKVQGDDGRAHALGMEMTRHDLKVGRRKGRTPFQVLADIAATGDMDEVRIWHEWERVSKGRQAITWGADVKACFGIVETGDDEEAARVEEGEVVLVVDHVTWALVRTHAGGMATLLDLVEEAGGAVDAALGWLAQLRAGPGAQ